MKGFKQGAQTGAGVASHGEAMGFKKGGQVKVGKMKQKPTGELRGKPTNEDDKALGGKSTLKPGYNHGGKVASAAHKTHSMPPKSQGRGKKPVGRGAKAVGKGGKTGMHKSGRVTKEG